MRNTLAVLAAVPTLMFATGAHAETLPSLSVPTFSVAYTSYEGYDYSDNPSYFPAAAHVVSSNAGATVISLDSHDDQLHIKTPSRGAWPAYVLSTLRFEAADGYRITGVEFSATASAVTTPHELPPGAILTSPHAWNSYAWANMALRPPGATGLLPDQYFDAKFLAPVEYRKALQNTADLRTFDLSTDIGVSAAVWAMWYTFPGAQDEYKLYGTTEAWFANPTLTVYTEIMPVPEPGTWAMLGAGLLLIGAARRTRRAD